MGTVGFCIFVRSCIDFWGSAIVKCCINVMYLTEVVKY